MGNTISNVTVRTPTKKSLPKLVTSDKPTASAFDRFLIKLGLKTVKPAKDPLKTLVGSWNRLPKPRVDSKTTRMKALTVIRHSGSGIGKGEKLTTSERGEILSSLNLKMEPCRADQVPSRIRDIILTKMTDKDGGGLISENMLKLLDSGSLDEVKTLLMDKILADNPWMQKSGITSQGLMDVARGGMDAILDGLLPRAMQDADKTRRTVGTRLDKMIGDPKKVGDLRMGVLQNKIKNRFTPKSDIKKVIEEMKALRADVKNNTKLLDYDRDQFLARIDRELVHMDMRLNAPIKLPGALSKLDWKKLSDDALRALVRLDEKGFLTDRFVARLADSSLCSSIDAANAVWPHLAGGDEGIIDIVIGDNHWDATALKMKLDLAEVQQDSELGKEILLRHKFTILKRNLGEALDIRGRFGKKVSKNKLPNNFRDIHADDKLLNALKKLNPKTLPERNVILANLVLMQLRVDGKDLKDTKVLAEARTMLKTLGITAEPKQVQTWAEQGFRSSKEVAGVLAGLHKFITKLGKNDQALKVIDEVLDSSPKAYAQRGIGEMSKVLLGFSNRDFALKNPKQVDSKVKDVIGTIKRELALGGGLLKLTDITNARDRLVKNIENAENRIKDIQNRAKNRFSVLTSDDSEGLKPDRRGRYRGLNSGLKALDVLRLQNGIDQVQKRLGKGKTSPALKLMITERNRLLKALDDYDTKVLHTPFRTRFSKKPPTLLSTMKTPEKKIAALRNKQKIIQAIVDQRLDNMDLKPLQNDVKKLKSNLKNIDKSYNKALGRIEEERIRDFVHLAVLRVFADSGKNFKDFKLADHKKALDKQLKDWDMDGPALKVVVDRLMNVTLSHDVIKQWTDDVQKQDERTAKVSKEIDKLLGNKQLAQSLAIVRASARIGSMMAGLKKNEGVSLKFGVSGALETADLPIGAGDAKLSLRMEAAAFDSINIRNTGNGFEVMIKGGGSGSLSTSLSGLMGMFEASGNVSAEHLKGAQFLFKSKKDATQFLTDVLSGKITEKTLTTVKTIRGVTDTSGEVSLKVKAGYSNEKEKDISVPNVDKTATFGLAVEIQAELGVSAQFTKSVRQNSQIRIQTYSRTYDVNARADAKLTGKIQVGDNEKDHSVDGNIQYRKRVTHGVEIHRSFGTILADTCVKTGMRAGDLPLVTLSALLPDDIRAKLDPAKLQTLLDALDGNADKMVTLESRITDDALHKINELRAKGGQLIKANKKTEGQKLLKQAETLLADPKSYAPTRLVIDADVFKVESEKVKSLLGGKVELKQFAMGERTFNGIGLNIADLQTK